MSVALTVAVDVDQVAESVPAQADTLNSLERLILAQAVYELGSDAWTNVSSILSQHPLLQVKRDNAIFSPSACQDIYHNLLRIVGLDSAEPEKQPRNAHSNNLKLAQRMYQARVLELKQLILAEEARFNSVAAEIEAIRTGKWDAKIEKDLRIDETTPDRPSRSLSPQSEGVSAIEVSGSDLTGVSDSSSSAPQLQADLPFPEEEMVQRQLDEDLTIPDPLPRDTTPSSTHEDDIEPSIAPKLSPVASPVTSPAASLVTSPVASPVGTDYVDEHIDLPGSPQLPHDSPDPLDIITPAEDDSEHEHSPTHERPEVAQPPSPSQPFEGSDGAVSATEPERSSIAEPPEIAEEHEEQLVEPSEVVDRSEAEVELESDGRALVSNSNPVEGETSTEDRSDMLWKDNVSMCHLSEPPVDHAVEPPSFEDTATSVTNTLKTDTPKTESEEATGTVEVKEEIQPDKSRPQEIQVKQDDKMDIEQENVPKAASPVAEQSRRDHKRKVSEAASIFSDSARDRKKTREDSQPVDEDEQGPARRRGRPTTADSQTSKKFQTVITMVHSQISQHRNGNIFHNPIKTSEAPDYYEIVKRPMDLKTIKSRIREGQITSSDEFQRDVYLMFANSLMYNRPGSDIFNMAEEMMLESEAQINTFRQTEGIIKGSHR